MNPVVHQTTSDPHGSPRRNVGVTDFGVADYSFNYTAPIGEGTPLVLVGTSSSTSLYVNGVLHDTLNLAFPLPRGQIGGSTRDRLAGTLDDLFLFDRELTAGEIGRIFAAGPNPSCGDGGSQ